MAGRLLPATEKLAQASHGVSPSGAAVNYSTTGDYATWGPDMSAQALMLSYPGAGAAVQRVQLQLHGRDRERNQLDRRADDRGDLSLPGRPQHQLAAGHEDRCQAAFLTSATGIGDHHGYRWAQGITGYSMFNTIQTPNDGKYTFGACRLVGGPYNYPDDGFTNSAHPGGVNTLFGDGRVKFIKNSIDRRTWWSLGTRSGDEVVSADAD
ncbi:MAG: DUF1559 domain-containing protein [Paludisphaera borealis]|uniref:H-X9-DG-CTERM domain-containing protein n=1 Tax=Paludisphaera borealis TaxID=1387353 RepID=UPI002847C080|nr:H-X9-DG-CTERM domain-containing protein [Paludisphaera borealis]MDR3621152.1 DUF1559 domain-containing protein [Paludisphaera borealis]